MPSLLNQNHIVESHEKGKTRPIIFSGEMVRAILEGRKTQTRRVIKPQPTYLNDHFNNPNCFNHRFEYSKEGVPTFKVDSVMKDCGFPTLDGGIGTSFYTVAPSCPYGLIGWNLWVRETWSYTGVGIWNVKDAQRWQDKSCVVYRADTDCEMTSGWFPSIHMPRWASRITLKITNIRVERLQDISAEDAIAEGLQKLPASGRYVVNKGEQYAGLASHNPKEVFEWLWESINGTDSWNQNPWVWVIEFERVANA